jgi:hypothetical protein
MNVRKPQKALTHHDVRALHEAAHVAKRHGVRFNTALAIHPGKLANPRQPMAEFVRREVVKRLGDFFRNNRVSFWGVWVRENYAEPGREHVHVVLHVPPRLKRRIEAAVARWWPEPDAAHLQDVHDLRGLLAYVSKQMSSRAAYAVRFRIRRETACRRNGALVAPVLGRRLGMTANLRRALDERRADAHASSSRSPERRHDR